MKKFEYDLTNIVTKQEARTVGAIPEIPQLKKMKKIVFEHNGKVNGISDYRYSNATTNKVMDYFGNRLDQLVRPMLDPIIKPTLGIVGLDQYVNKIKSLQSILAGYGVKEGFSALVNGCVQGASFLFDVFTGLKSISDIDSVIGGIADGIISGITNDITNLVDGLIENTLDALGIYSLFNFLDNIRGGERWGDAIPNRPVYIITMTNTITGDVYKSCRPQNDEMAITYGPNIETTDIVGRTGPLVAFNNMTNTFSVEIYIHEDLLARGTFQQNLNVLKNMVHPKYSNGLTLTGGTIKYPKVRVTLGGTEKFLCVATSLDVSQKTYILDKRGRPIAGSATISFTILGKADGTLASMKNY